MKNQNNLVDSIDFSPIQYWAIRLHTNRKYLNEITTADYIRNLLELNDICYEATYQREISEPPRNNDHWHIFLTTYSDEFLVTEKTLQNLFSIYHHSEYCKKSFNPRGYLAYCSKHATRMEGPFHWTRAAYVNALETKKSESNILSYFSQKP